MTTMLDLLNTGSAFNSNQFFIFLNTSGCARCGDVTEHVGLFVPSSEAELRYRNFHGLSGALYRICSNCSRVRAPDDEIFLRPEKILADGGIFLRGDEAELCLKNLYSIDEFVKLRRELPQAGSPRWHIDFTNYDREPMARNTTLVDFYRMFLTYMSSKHSDKHVETGLMVLSEYLFIRIGRPRWFISKEMFEILLTLKTDTTDFTNIAFPYDVFSFVFERGITLGGMPLRWFRVCCPRSRLSLQIMKEVVDVQVPNITSAVSIHPDLGMNRWTRKVDENTRPANTNVKAFFCPLLELSKASGPEMEGFKYPLAEIVKILASAVLLYAARPEFYQEYKVERSQRYEFKGERTSCRRLCFPTMKKVRAAQESKSTGAFKSPHFRGWVLRTLRAERYTRNLDGTFKVALVPPTAIHPELMEAI